MKTGPVALAFFAISSSSALSQTTSCPPDLTIKGALEGPITNCFKELTQQTAALTAELKALKSKRNDRPTFPPVGTIIASYLRPDEFTAAIGEKEGSALDKRTWVLADGREVIGTQFAILTHGKRIPELRNMFLRGVPSLGSREVGSLEDAATALPKVPFKGVTSANGALTLPRSADRSGADRYNAGGQNYPIITAGPPQPVGPHTHTVSINGGGDSETRPMNVAVYYYIKIN